MVGIAFEQWLEICNKQTQIRKLVSMELHPHFSFGSYWTLQKCLRELEGTLMDSFSLAQICICLQGIWLSKSLQLLENTYSMLWLWTLGDLLSILDGPWMLPGWAYCRSHYEGSPDCEFKRDVYDALCNCAVQGIPLAFDLKPCGLHLQDISHNQIHYIADRHHGQQSLSEEHPPFIAPKGVASHDYSVIYLINQPSSKILVELVLQGEKFKDILPSNGGCSCWFSCGHVQKVPILKCIPRVRKLLCFPVHRTNNILSMEHFKSQMCCSRDAWVGTSEHVHNWIKAGSHHWMARYLWTFLPGRTSSTIFDDGWLMRYMEEVIMTLAISLGNERMGVLHSMTVDHDVYQHVRDLVMRYVL